MDLSQITEALKALLSSETDEQLWIADARVWFEGDWEEFQSSFDENEADFLATEIRTYAGEPGWNWWSSISAPHEEDLLESEVAALLPLIRVSRAAAEAILKGIDEGWEGHPEVLIPTLVNRAGLKIEDIGGAGSFTPPERIERWYDKRTWHWKGPVEHVPDKLHFPLLSRYHAKPADKLSPEPQVAFLFLTRGDVHHREIWEEYLMQAGQRARVYAHTKDMTFLSGESFLRDWQIAGKVETAWGELSLVHATLALLKTALQDSDTTHFILVSESCVPVRPFEQLRVNLRRDNRSRLRVWTLDEVRRGGNRDKVKRLEQLTGISKNFAYFQEQWMCLSREDAEIVTEKDWTPCFERVYAADECYFATVLAESGKPPADVLPNRPITWTDWRGGAHPQEYHQVLPHTAAQIAESGCFFARKFAPDSNIGRWKLHLE